MQSISVAERKAALRTALQALPPEDFTGLLTRFLALPQVAAAQTLLLFHGVGREPNTRPVMEELIRRGKTVALPRCLPGREMEARQVTSDTALVLSAYGIPEPGEACPVVPKQTIDLILVPNLCCDRQGYRLGYGGGYYDRYLSAFKGETVALCPAAWLREALPRDGFDIPVRLVLSE